MTYGLYSGGTSLDVKRQAVAKIRYDFSVVQSKDTSALRQKKTAKKVAEKKTAKTSK